MATQCNLAAKEPTSTWRNMYYVDEVSQIIKLFAHHTQQRDGAPDPFVLAQAISAPSLQRPQGAEDGHFGFTIPDLGNRDASAAVSPIPLIRFEASPNYNYPSAGLPIVSWARQDSTPVTPISHPVTLSDFQSLGSPSSSQAISESSPTAASSMQCASCDHFYHGTPSSQRRSLRRHWLQAHSHNPRLQCLVPGCTTDFAPGRHDNLNRHMEVVHGWASSPNSRTAHRRRRAT